MRSIVCFAIFVVAVSAVTRVPFSALDAKVQKAAKVHLARAAHLVDGAWDGADLLSAIPLHRPDVVGPAYWEVQVDNNGSPAGVMHVATGDHDHPVTFFTEHGSSAFGDDVLSQEPLVLNERQLVGKSRAQDLQTKRERKDIQRSWRDLDTSLLQVNGVDSGTTSTTDQPGDLRGKTCVRMPNNDPNFPLFEQYKSSSGCYSGCGPTALAMLFTWGAALGKSGVQPWKGCFERSTIPTGGSANSPGVETMTKALGSKVGTFCVPFGGGNAATAPYNPIGKDMGSAKSYLGEKGSTATFSYDGSVLGRSAYAGKALEGIRSGSATIIGVGSYPASAHYILVSCHGTSGGKNWWRANMGWGGTSNGWLYSNPWFAGYLQCSRSFSSLISDVVNSG